MSKTMPNPKRYQVTRGGRVFDHRPGEVFTRDLDPAHEARLVAAGSIRVLPDDPEPSNETSADKSLDEMNEED